MWLTFSSALSLGSKFGSAYAKLGMISSALSSDSDDVTKLLNVSLDLIAPMSDAKLPKPTARKSGSNGTAADLNKLTAGGGIADSERAVEVLSFLVSKTKVTAPSAREHPARGTSAPFDAVLRCLTCRNVRLSTKLCVN